MLIKTNFLIISIICSNVLQAQNKSDLPTIEEFIEVMNLTDSAIMITIGAEAITAVASSKGIIVIDAGTSNTLTGKYRKVIEHEFNRTDFLYLINTHAHWDHITGNAVFADAIIIGHENCPVEYAKRKRDPEKMKSWTLKIINDYQKELDTMQPGTSDWVDAFCQQKRFQAVYDDLSQSQIDGDWDITFSDELSLNTGDIHIEMKYFGKGHSTSDIITHIPEYKLLFTGDLFSKWGRPSIDVDSTSEIQKWKETMDWVMHRKDKIETIIGGHGQIMSMDDLAAFNEFVDKNYRELILK